MRFKACFGHRCAERCSFVDGSVVLRDFYMGFKACFGHRFLERCSFVDGSMVLRDSRDVLIINVRDVIICH